VEENIPVVAARKEEGGIRLVNEAGVGKKTKLDTVVAEKVIVIGQVAVVVGAGTNRRMLTEKRQKYLITNRQTKGTMTRLEVWEVLNPADLAVVMEDVVVVAEAAVVVKTIEEEVDRVVGVADDTLSYIQ